MKNIVLIILSVIIVFSIDVYAKEAQELTANPIYCSIVVDGQEKNFVVNEQEKKFNDQIIMLNDRTYLPLRDVAEILGCEVSWIEGGNRIVIVSKDYRDNNLYRYEENGLYGYKDYQGNVIIKAQFSYANEFSEGMAAVSTQTVSLGGEYKTYGKIGYIDTKGEFVIPEQYDDAYDFHDGIALIAEGEIHSKHYFYINSKGEKIFEQEFNLAFSFSEGVAVVLKEGPGGPPLPPGFEDLRKYAYIDTNGQYINDMVFQDANSFYNGYAMVMNHGKWGLINKDFELVIDYQYDTIEDLRKSSLYKQYVKH